MTVIFYFVLVAAFPALVIFAAVSDLTSFKIPNILPASISLLFLAFALVMVMTGRGMEWSDLGWHLVAGICGLVLGAILFAFGWIGGGDAKLFAAVSMWFGLSAFVDYAFFISLIGGVFTLFLLAARKLPVPRFLHGQSWLLRLADAESPIPYGCAIAAATLVVLPRSEIFLLASGS